MSTDATAYAKAIGYRGSRPVVVVDGKVVSHRRQDWFEFCEKLKRNAQNRDEKPAGQ